jgi:hypothetical protein
MTTARRVVAANGPLLAAGILAALPVILSTVHALAVGWTPVGDDAVIAARSYDVFTSHSPLVGQYSASSVVLGEVSHSPGPMLYWLLALPARFGGPAAMVLTMGALNAASSFGAVAIARRRGGNALMVVAAGTVAVMSASLVGHTYSDVWNPAAGLLPFTLLIFLAWAIGCGDVRLVPVAALVGSFAVQCHLTFLLPTAGLLIVAGAGLLAARTRPSRRTLIVTAVTVLVCWSGPLLDEIVHRPGNLEILVRTAFSGTPTAGVETGVRAAIHAVGVPPWWLSIVTGPNDRIADIAKPVGAGSIASGTAILAMLAALFALAVKRRRRDVALAAAQAVVMAVAIALVAGGNPTKGLLVLSLGYTLWWGSAAGAWAWMTLVIGSVVMFKRQPLARLNRPRVVLALALLGAAIAIARLAVAGPGEELQKPHYAPMRALAKRLETRLSDGATVLVIGTRNSGLDAQFDYLMGSIYALRRDGHRVLTTQNTALGAGYDPRGQQPQYILRVLPANAVPQRTNLLLQTLANSDRRGLAVTLEHVP